MSGQIHPSGSADAPAGWYSVEGDPPGTMRRWNGDQWIGVPTHMEGSTETTPQQQQRKPLGRLALSGVVAAVVSVVGFVFMAAIMISLVLSLSDVVSSGVVGTLSDSAWLLMPLMLITTVSFTSWATRLRLPLALFPVLD